MVTVIYRQTHSPSRLAWSEGWPATQRSVWIHQMNWVNSCSDHGHEESTINIVGELLLLLLLLMSIATNTTCCQFPVAVAAVNHAASMPQFLPVCSAAE